MKHEAMGSSYRCLHASTRAGPPWKCRRLLCEGGAGEARQGSKAALVSPRAGDVGNEGEHKCGDWSGMARRDLTTGPQDGAELAEDSGVAGLTPA